MQRAGFRAASVEGLDVGVWGPSEGRAAGRHGRSPLLTRAGNACICPQRRVNAPPVGPRSRRRSGFSSAGKKRPRRFRREEAYFSIKRVGGARNLAIDGLGRSDRWVLDAVSSGLHQLSPPVSSFGRPWGRASFQIKGPERRGLPPKRSSKPWLIVLPTSPRRSGSRATNRTYVAAASEERTSRSAVPPSMGAPSSIGPRSVCRRSYSDHARSGSNN